MRGAGRAARVALPFLALAGCDIYVGFGLGGSKLPTAAEAREMDVRDVGDGFERRGCRVGTALLPDAFTGPHSPRTAEDVRVALRRLAREDLIREEGDETVFLGGECRPGPPPAPDRVPPGTVAPRPAR